MLSGSDLHVFGDLGGHKVQFLVVHLERAGAQFANSVYLYKNDLKKDGCLSRRGFQTIWYRVLYSDLVEVRL